MATKSQAYDHPTYITRHFTTIPLVATAASTSVQKFLALTDMKIKSANVIVKTAGTADAAGYDLLNGTSSVGSIGVGTAAAAALGTAFVGDITVTSGSYLDIKTKAASATLAADIAIEWHTVAGANVTL